MIGEADNSSTATIWTQSVAEEVTLIKVKSCKNAF